MQYFWHKTFNKLADVWANESLRRAHLHGNKILFVLGCSIYYKKRAASLNYSSQKSVTSLRCNLTCVKQGRRVIFAGVKLCMLDIIALASSRFLDKKSSSIVFLTYRSRSWWLPETLGNHSGNLCWKCTKFQNINDADAWCITIKNFFAYIFLCFGSWINRFSMIDSLCSLCSELVSWDEI